MIGMENEFGECAYVAPEGRQEAAVLDAPDRLWISFASCGEFQPRHVRQWQSTPFPDGYEYVRSALIPAKPAVEVVEEPAVAFARWLEDGPRLAKAAGCYVGIKVTGAAALQAPATPDAQTEVENDPRS